MRFSRIRRSLAVVLALAFVPATSGGVRCVEHESATDVEHVSEADGEHGTRDHEHHAAISAHNHSVHASEDLSSSAMSAISEMQLSAEQCCPPAGVPGTCGNAMGCGVLGTPARANQPPVRMLAGTQPEAATHALAPGPAPAPDVPPPRA